MKKLLVALVSVAVMTIGLVPAQAAGEYVVRQKTLSDAIGSATALNSKQRAEIKQVVDVIVPARVKLGGGWAMDASLKLGESVTSDGWTITVKETGSFGDVVEVKKAS